MISVRTPGSSMLFGEHSVLHGEPALVMALDRYITVRFTPITPITLAYNELTVDAMPMVDICSDLGKLRIPLAEALSVKPATTQFSFVIAAIQAALTCANHAPAAPNAIKAITHAAHGFRLDIESDMPATIGLGTSAAVTVATMAALWQWQRRTYSNMELWQAAMHAVRTVQEGRGSGADIAASVWGGVVAFQNKPLFVCKPLLHRVALHYVGYKTPTVEVIKRVAAYADNADYVSELYPVMGTLTARVIHHWQEGRLSIPRLGAYMNRANRQLVVLGVSDAKLAAICAEVRAIPGVVGAKISGSGLGDCVVSIADRSCAEVVSRKAHSSFQLHISEQGCSLC